MDGCQESLVSMPDQVVLAGSEQGEGVGAMGIYIFCIPQLHSNYC